MKPPATALPAPPCTFLVPERSEVADTAPSPGARPRWFETEILVHERALRAYLRMKFPKLSDPDDLIQEAYLRILQAHASRGLQPSRGYLFTVVRNLAYDLCRHHAVVPMDPLEETTALTVSTPEPDAAMQAAQDNEHALLSAAIAALPERAREVIMLRKLRGLSHREIAAQLGISERTSGAHMNAAMAKVRDYLLEHGVDRQP